MDSRTSKQNYYLDIADSVLVRSTCLRRKYGAIIVRNDEIISTGYNGAPRGRKNCSDLGVCTRETLKIPSGERYELCRSVHAEANAIISASRRDMIGATLYLVGRDAKTNELLKDAMSCSMCKRHIINAGIETVIDPDTQESSTATVTYPPLIFEPTSSQTATRARFRWEPTRFITCPVDAAGSSPAIITIHGPLVNPTWVHYLVKGDSSVVVGTGSFTRSVELLDGDQLVIDSTPSKYTITHLHANGTESDLYPYRNFGETCFINLKTGINRILVMSEDGTLATNVEVKGQIYDATV